MPVVTINPSGQYAEGEEQGVAYPPAFDQMVGGFRIAKDEWTPGAATDVSRLRVAVALYNLSALNIASVNSATLKLNLGASDYSFNNLTIFSGGTFTTYAGPISEFAAEWYPYSGGAAPGSAIYGTDDTAQDALAPYDMAQHTTTGDETGSTQAVNLSLPLLNAAANIEGDNYVALRFAVVGTPGLFSTPVGDRGEGFYMNFTPVIELDYVEAGAGGADVEGEAVMLLSAEGSVSGIDVAGEALINLFGEGDLVTFRNIPIEIDGVLSLVGSVDVYGSRDILLHRARLRKGGP